jgi:hypothetical protein
LCCWISPGYGPFSLGARVEIYEMFISLIYEPFISLIFHFFSGSKPRITETADTESVYTGARLYTAAAVVHLKVMLHVTLFRP